MNYNSGFPGFTKYEEWNGQLIGFCKKPLVCKHLGLLNYFFIKTIYNIRCRLANYLYLCMIYVMKKEALEKEN